MFLLTVPTSAPQTSDFFYSTEDEVPLCLQEKDRDRERHRDRERQRDRETETESERMVL